MRMSPEHVEAYCKRTGQMDKLEKMAPRKEPPKEYPKYNDKVNKLFNYAIEGINIKMHEPIYGEPLLPLIKEHPKTKYGNIPTEVNGIMFPSKKEAQYYVQLLMQLRCGLIEKFEDIELQPVYDLQPSFKKNGKTYKRITYKPDFRTKYKDGHVEIVDTKGKRTEAFNIKYKLFEYKYPDLTLILV